MHIDDLLRRRRPVFSMEFFPPDTPDGDDRLFRVIDRLREDATPDFVSVTCRNHSRARTVELTTRIRREAGLEPMAHLTCAGATRSELLGSLRALADSGVENVLALRGDPPVGGAFSPAEDGLKYASELAEMIVEGGHNLAVGGACYPELHVESRDLDADLEATRRKVEAGCTFLITQLFFSTELYFAYVERARGAGITVPILPGIMPITRISQLSRLNGSLYGATIPAALRDALLRREGDEAAVLALGASYATVQCSELLAGGAPGIHFYTLNRSPATRAVLSALLAARPWERAYTSPHLRHAQTANADPGVMPSSTQSSQ